MPHRTDPTDWMWAHALDVMSQAERMHRQFFRLASTTCAQATWEPPVDVFESEDELVIVVALPGVSAERVQVTSESGALVLRAERPPAFAGSGHAVRQLEIPYGGFERRIPLPEGRWRTGPLELTHGCLVLRLQRIV